jgi:hypothetical protein
VKVARTVATGGMEKRAVGTALCPYPLDRHQLDEPPGPHSAQNKALMYQSQDTQIRGVRVSCPESVKYYSKPLPSAPMALEKGVHS